MTKSSKLSYTRKSELKDLIGHVALRAPDRFPAWTGTTLESAFEEIREGITSLEKRLGSPERVTEIRQLIDDSEKAYRSGDIKTGTFILQDLLFEM